jgi:hypothetical protein
MISLLIGIGATLIAAIIISVISLNWRHLIFPWIKSIIYKEKFLPIEGIWIFFFQSLKSKNPDMRMHIKQTGPYIKGNLQVYRWADGSTGDMEYKVIGEIIGEKLHAHFKDHSSKLFGSYILQIKEQGKVLEGKGVGLDPTAYKIVVFDRKWLKEI